MTRNLHYVFGDTKLARLEALVQRYGKRGMRREIVGKWDRKGSDKAAERWANRLEKWLELVRTQILVDYSFMTATHVL